MWEIHTRGGVGKKAKLQQNADSIINIIDEEKRVRKMKQKETR